MSKTLPPKPLAARPSDALRKRVDRAIATTNQTESALIRTALEEFFTNHKTPTAIIEAVIASVRREAA